VAAIGWLWREQIRKRLGTEENLRQQLIKLGTEPEE
jgi:hypothetical protein